MARLSSIARCWICSISCSSLGASPPSSRVKLSQITTTRGDFSSRRGFMLSFLSLLRRGDGSQLLHQPHHIDLGPVFGDFAIEDPEDIGGSESNVLVRRRHPVEAAGIRAAPDQADGDPITFG